LDCSWLSWHFVLGSKKYDIRDVPNDNNP
jgi:hypothetical protein